jgi:hypothetical protein
MTWVYKYTDIEVNDIIENITEDTNLGIIRDLLSNAKVETKALKEDDLIKVLTVIQLYNENDEYDDLKAIERKIIKILGIGL